MPRKKPTRVPPTPPVAVVVAPKTTAANVLLDWRFNLIVIGCMELMLVAFSLPREITRYRARAGQAALWREDFTRAFHYFSLLDQDEPNNGGYLRAIGDTFLGRRRYQEALRFYQQAGGKDFGVPEIKIQAARAFYGLAQSTTDPGQQNQWVELARKLVQAAHQEAPDDLKVNYWLGWFSLNERDLIAAADYFSRVRAEAIPGHFPPNEEQARLIKRAQDNLRQIHSLIFSDKDYPLDLRGLEIVSTPTLARPPLPPGVKPTTTPVAPVSTPAPVALTPAPASAKTPTIVATPGIALTPAAVAPAPAVPKPTATPAPVTTPPPAAATPAATPQAAATSPPPAAPTPAPPSPTPATRTTSTSPAK